MELNFQDSQVLFVTLFFLLVLAWDIGWQIFKRYKKSGKWIPERALVLSALTVQLVGYFDSTYKLEEKQVKVLLENQLRIDAARLCLCVFLGNVQPEMASASGAKWSSIAALAISLSLHLTTEVKALQSAGDAESTSGKHGSLVSTSVALVAGVAFLVVCLGCTVLSGKFIRDSLSQKIPEFLSDNVQKPADASSSDSVKKPSDAPSSDNVKNPSDASSSSSNNLQKSSDAASSDDVKNKVLKSWDVIFAFNAQYKLVSIAFVPAVGSVVTICVVLMGAKVRRLWRDSSDLGLTFYVQCVFVIVGWIVILYRWFKIMSSYASVTSSMLLDVSRFTKCSFTVLYISIINVFKRIPVPFVKILASLIVPFIVFIISDIVSRVLRSVFIICLGCWLLSACLVSFPARVLNLKETASEEQLLTLKQIMVSPNSKDILSRLSRLYKASYELIEGRMKKAEQEMGKCTGLQTAIMESKNVARFEKKRLWKMRAVAIIDVMVLLIEKGCDLEVVVERTIEAYKQAVGLLEFLDCPENIAIDYINLFGTCNFEAAALSLAADLYVLKIQRARKKMKRPSDSERPIPNFVEVRQRLESYSGSPGSSKHSFQIGNLASCDIFEILDNFYPDLKEAKKELPAMLCKWLCKWLGRVGNCLCGWLQPVGEWLYGWLQPVGEWLYGWLQPVGKWLWGWVSPVCVVVWRLLWPVVKCVICLVVTCVIVVSVLSCLCIMLLSFPVAFISLLLYTCSDALAIPIADESQTLALQDVSSSIIKFENEPKMLNELVQRVTMCFNDLLASCVQTIPEVLVEYSNQWARELEGEKISKAVEIAAKVTQLKKMIKETEKDARDSEDIQTKVEGEIKKGETKLAEAKRDKDSEADIQIKMEG